MKINSTFFETLPNGTQVAGETFDNVLSVSVGFFFKSGVLYEMPKHLGVSHFIEHMLFKGTKKRTAKDIARQFDRIGGYLNAFTAKDYCCYYARVIKDHVPMAIEILSDMVSASSFDSIELERERRVILEEIKMYEDSPDEIIHELLGQNLWRHSPLGRPILGTVETVSTMPREEILAIYRDQYIGDNLMVCAAGNFDRGEFVNLLKKHLKPLKRGTRPQKKIKPRPFFETALYQKEIEQVHLAMGTVGTTYRDQRRYAVTVLNTAFGGGMSSRLFQEIREKRGLAYSVYSYHTAFCDTGLFAIYAATSLENLGKVLDLVQNEIAKMARRGLTKVELSEAKDQLKGNLLMALESTTNRMNRLMSGFLYGVEPVDPVESIKPILKVTMDDIAEAAHDLLKEEKMAITVVAPPADIGKVLRNSAFTDRPVHSLALGKSTPHSHDTSDDS